MGWIDWLNGRGWNPEPEPTSTAIEEAVPMTGFGYDPDLHHTPEQLGTPYVRRLSQDSTRQLPEMVLDRARDLAYHLYQTNPLAKRSTELIRDYVLGEDVTVRAAY